MIWLMLLLFFVLANLPWFGDRVLLVYPLKTKPIWIRLAELLVFYFVILLLGDFFESRFSGDIYPQAWEFYVTTFCLFVVMSVPGWVYRYQWLPLRRKWAAR